MLPYYEKSQFPCNCEEKLLRAEVAVRHPHIAFMHRPLDIVEQDAFRSMAVGRKKNVGGQTGFRLQDDQNSTRQGSVPDGPQRLQAMFGARQLVAVENTHRIAGQPRLTSRLQFVDDRSRLLRRIANQREVRCPFRIGKRTATAVRVRAGNGEGACGSKVALRASILYVGAGSPDPQRESGGLG